MPNRKMKTKRRQLPQVKCFQMHDLKRKGPTAPPSARKETPPWLTTLQNREILCFDVTGARTNIGGRRAAVHIVNRKELIEHELATSIKAKQPISVRTENGLLELTEVCQVFAKASKARLWAYIRDDTTPLLSIGLRVDELGHSFTWNPRRSPKFRKGKISMRCHPTNNVPRIYPGASIEDASNAVESKSLPTLEHPGTDEDRSEGHYQLNDSLSLRILTKIRRASLARAFL